MMMGLGVFLVTGIPTGIFGGKKKKDAKLVKSSRVITFGRIVTTVGEQFARACVLQHVAGMDAAARQAAN